ncbi:uncharacterized protein LOC119075247 [Bradysia coprophila]|uniref:uncharacterized protein LOC119075247 n=1 Tax=Bradysia coprophila TaxID=38358 RepID=UPI00187DB559|nr:uncharacterized protein LOC119075247 [Bradysia coprophila]
MFGSIVKVLAVISLLSVAEGIDHCQSNQFHKSQNSTNMQLTKEAVSQEYAVIGAFKSLHCCAKGYRSIEWFKDGKPYPWPNDVSSLILYPEAENQTIYTRSASFADVGNYTCTLRNDTHKSEHHVALNVQGSVPDNPLPTFRPQNQFVPLDEPARLYCEAFVGKVKLPDARSSIAWFQVFENANEQEVDGEQIPITREDDQIIGAYLIIPRIKTHNYGRYLCRVEIGNSAHRLDMFAWIFGQPTVVESDSVLAPLCLALLAAILTVGILVLAKYLLAWCSYRQKRELNQCRALDTEAAPALRASIKG